ncbi:MAG: acyltransferase family protein [Candidatus Korobacteraceae bacterium]
MVCYAQPEAEVVRPVAEFPAMQGRLVSLDVFRGATIAAMILVNNPGSRAAYGPLKHARWNGWTPTDLIFPFFLFIVGVSLVFSFASRLRRGDSRRTLLLHTLRRSATIFAIGLLLNGPPHFTLTTWRIPGVLQRIAIAYLAAALITLYARTNARIAWIASLLIGYWALMRFVPVPGYGTPNVDIPLLHPNANLAAYVDRNLMFGHLWEGTRDPEGVLSTLPAIATALCGVLTGEWLRSRRNQKQKAAGMLIAGVAGIGAGELWGIWFPINKNLWTSSYVLFTAGCALVCLASCYWAVDVKLLRGWWTRPFVIFGTNAIAAYVISEVLGGSFGWKEWIFQRTFAHVSPPAFASLLYSLAVVGVCFLPVWWMYRRRIFLKV